MLPRLAPKPSLTLGSVLRTWLGLALVLLLCACSVDSQQVDPTLDIDTNLSARGQGQPVRIRIEDGRPSQTLGHRTGNDSDSAAVVLSSEEIRPQLLTQTNKAVRLLGYTPTDRTDVPVLRVILSSLSYQVPNGTGLRTDVDVAATLRGLVSQPDGRSYSGRYSATMQQSFMGVPSARSNSEMISSVLTDALNRMFRDPMISRTLRAY